MVLNPIRVVKAKLSVKQRRDNVEPLISYAIHSLSETLESKNDQHLIRARAKSIYLSKLLSFDRSFFILFWLVYAVYILEA